MASRDFDDLQVLGKQRKYVTGRFAPNGSSALVAANTVGNGFTVARTGVGLFVVTLQDVYFNWDSVWAKLHSATLGKIAQISVVPVVASKTFTIALSDSALQTAYEAPADTNTVVSFGIMLKNTSGNF